MDPIHGKLRSYPPPCPGSRLESDGANLAYAAHLRLAAVYRAQSAERPDVRARRRSCRLAAVPCVTGPLCVRAIARKRAGKNARHNV